MPYCIRMISDDPYCNHPECVDYEHQRRNREEDARRNHRMKYGPYTPNYGTISDVVTRTGRHMSGAQALARGIITHEHMNRLLLNAKVGDTVTYNTETKEITITPKENEMSPLNKKITPLKKAVAANKYYVAATHISNAVMAGRKEAWTSDNLETAIQNAKDILKKDPSMEGVAIVEIIRVVRRPQEKFSVEKV